MVEKAVHIKGIKDLQGIDRKVFSRLYWGAEFCQKLMPDIAQTDRVFSFASLHKFSVSLVFPFVTESGLARVLKLCSWLANSTFRPELVVNDWGILHAIRTRYPGVFSFALGRLLVRQQRMPMARFMLEQQPPVGVKMYDRKKVAIIYHRVPNRNCQLAMRSAYVNTPLSVERLQSWGIKRVELNNVLQGINLLGMGFKKSLHTPLVHVSTTRYCPMETIVQKKIRISGCSRQCSRFLDQLSNRSIPFPLIKLGNSIFYENPVSETSIPQGIDRLVVQLLE